MCLRLALLSYTPSLSQYLPPSPLLSLPPPPTASEGYTAGGSLSQHKGPNASQHGYSQGIGGSVASGGGTSDIAGGSAPPGKTGTIFFSSLVPKFHSTAFYFKQQKLGVRQFPVVVLLQSSAREFVFTLFPDSIPQLFFLCTCNFFCTYVHVIVKYLHGCYMYMYLERSLGINDANFACGVRTAAYRVH